MKIKIKRENFSPFCPECESHTTKWYDEIFCSDPTCNHTLTKKEIKKSIDEQIKEFKREK